MAGWQRFSGWCAAATMAGVMGMASIAQAQFAPADEATAGMVAFRRSSEMGAQLNLVVQEQRSGETYGTVELRLQGFTHISDEFKLPTRRETRGMDLETRVEEALDGKIQSDMPKWASEFAEAIEKRVDAVSANIVIDDKARRTSTGTAGRQPSSTPTIQGTAPDGSSVRAYVRDPQGRLLTADQMQKVNEQYDAYQAGGDDSAKPTDDYDWKKVEVTIEFEGEISTPVAKGKAKISVKGRIGDFIDGYTDLQGTAKDVAEGLVKWLNEQTWTPNWLRQLLGLPALQQPKPQPKPSIWEYLSDPWFWFTAWA
jgi:hypothetical protein